MDEIDLKVLLEKGENTRLKIRCNFYGDTIRTLSAFSNTSGGKVIIDRGRCLKSTDLSVITGQWRLEMDKRTRPAIDVDMHSEKIDGKAYILLSVNESVGIPIAFDGNYFCRENDKDKKMDLNDLINLYERWSESR